MIEIVNATSHLTARRRAVLRAMIERGLWDVKAGRTVYRLESIGDRYKAKITENEANDYGKMVPKTQTAEFSIR